MMRVSDLVLGTGEELARVDRHASSEPMLSHQPRMVS
jgi:hypothetical protein